MQFRQSFGLNNFGNRLRTHASNGKLLLILNLLHGKKICDTTKGDAQVHDGLICATSFGLSCLAGGSPISG